MKLNVISGYRTESTQENLFNNSVKKNGESHALIYSAKPGYSEHQLGLAIDINSVEENFKNTYNNIFFDTIFFSYECVF